MTVGGRPLETGPKPAGAANGVRAAVQRWLETLDRGQRANAVFAFGTDERYAWDYRPGSRRGVALADMTDPQRTAAMAIVDAAMSRRGAGEVRSIIALEPILGELERRSGRAGIRRDPERYWFAVFGDPGGTAPWSWRMGGHHLAVHSTLAEDRVLGTAPSFLGANPATVPDGPDAGRRAIDGEERLARALLASLSASQRRLAIVDPVAPPDILSGNGRRADPRDVPTGIRHDQLEPGQQTALEGLILHYVDRAHRDIAGFEWERIRDAGLGSVSFAWAGADTVGGGHYYAIRGPSLLVEYDNTQNGANHIHSVWRDLANDWGEDMLREHYAADHRVP
jgi:hypothetical protein